MRRLEGKVAVITGGAKSIGAGIARRFAVEGATVVIAGMNERAAEETIQQVRAAGSDLLHPHRRLQRWSSCSAV